MFTKKGMARTHLGENFPFGLNVTTVAGRHFAIISSFVVIYLVVLHLFYE